MSAYVATYLAAWSGDWCHLAATFGLVVSNGLHVFAAVFDLTVSIVPLSLGLGDSESKQYHPGIQLNISKILVPNKLK